MFDAMIDRIKNTPWEITHEERERKLERQIKILQYVVLFEEKDSDGIRWTIEANNDVDLIDDIKVAIKVSASITSITEYVKNHNLTHNLTYEEIDEEFDRHA